MTTALILFIWISLVTTLMWVSSSDFWESPWKKLYLDQFQSYEDLRLECDSLMEEVDSLSFEVVDMECKINNAKTSLAGEAIEYCPKCGSDTEIETDCE